MQTKQVNELKAIAAKCNNILAQYSSGQAIQARSQLEALAKQYPANDAVILTRATVLYHDKHYPDADQIISELSAQLRTSLRYLFLAASIKKELQDFPAAKTLYHKALALAPNNNEILFALGLVSRYLGEQENAIKYFEQLVAFDSQNYSAMYNLSIMKSYRFDEELIKRFIAGFNSDISQKDQVSYYFTLYSHYKNGKLFNEAFQFLKKANNMLAQLNSGKAFPIASLRNRLINNYQHKDLLAATDLPALDNLPVLIVGMPRSGSTLLEQMLSSHTEIAGLGEQSDIPGLINNVLDSRKSSIVEIINIFKKCDSKTLSGHVDDYSREVHKRAPGENIYIDKYLNNFLHLGFIHCLLPNAKIIHIKRNPIANCFGCYETNFTDAHPYSNNLDSLAQYYIEYSQIMDFWHAELNKQHKTIHTVEYEALIQQPEEAIRECLEFIGVEYEAACLKFHQSKRSVFTASADQVREPINFDSNEKWKVYKSQLGGLIQSLSDAGLCKAQ